MIVEWNLCEEKFADLMSPMHIQMIVLIVLMMMMKNATTLKMMLMI